MSIVWLPIFSYLPFPFNLILQGIGWLPISNNFVVGVWQDGVVEHGSSGCALFNGSNKVVGMLHGGVCGFRSTDYFGQFRKGLDV